MSKSYSDIILLLRAGYSREEIDAMSDGPKEQPQPQPQPQPQETPAPSPAPVPAEPAPAQPIQPSQPDQPPDAYQALLQELQGMRQLLQNQNLQGARQPAPQPQLTGDQVLANIIAPPRRQN